MVSGLVSGPELEAKKTKVATPSQAKPIQVWTLVTRYWVSPRPKLGQEEKHNRSDEESKERKAKVRPVLWSEYGTYEGKEPPSSDRMSAHAARVVGSQIGPSSLALRCGVRIRNSPGSASDHRVQAWEVLSLPTLPTPSTYLSKISTRVQQPTRADWNARLSGLVSHAKN